MLRVGRGTRVDGPFRSMDPRALARPRPRTVRPASPSCRTPRLPDADPPSAASTRRTRPTPWKEASMRPVRTLLSSLALAAALVLGGSATALAEGPTPSPAAAQTVRPEAPEFDDEEGLFWIPEQDGVQYLVVEEDVEWVLEPGEWYWDGPVTIRARATAGYTLTGTTTWSHEFPEWIFEPEHPFIDVPRGSEHEEAIDFMYWAGLSTGWDTPRGPEYRPLSPVNRDAMAAFLYRLEGEPRVSLPKKSPFTDVSPSSEH